MDCKPKNAELYGWNKFVRWGKKWGISFENEDDWKPWWDCWMKGYLAGIKGDR